MSDNTRDELATALAEHEPYGGGWFCRCTPEDDDGIREVLPNGWDAHLADALLASPAFARLLDQARAEAWDEGYLYGYWQDRGYRDEDCRSKEVPWHLAPHLGLSDEPSEIWNPYRTGADQ